MTVADAAALFEYDPDTGVLSPRPGANAGVRRRPDGYWIAWRQKGKRLYLGHRVAWLLHHGAWPVHGIDHINGDKSDNRIANLREATQHQNGGNQRLRRNNTSGFKGVCWDTWTNRWVATIMAHGKHHNLGRFDSPEDAHAAYMTAAVELYGDFARAK